MKWNFVTLIPYIYTNNSVQKKTKKTNAILISERWASSPTFTRGWPNVGPRPQSPTDTALNFFWLARHRNASLHVIPLLETPRFEPEKSTKKNLACRNHFRLRHARHLSVSRVASRPCPTRAPACDTVPQRCGCP